MHRLKAITIIAILSLLALSLTACSPAGQPAANGGPLPTLKVGAISSVDVVPIILAQEKGYFTKEGIDFTFEPFKSAKDRDAAFQSGTLDGLICDEIAVSLYQNAGIDLKITGVTDGDFMLVASPASGVKSVADLKGKSVAISEKTSIEYTLDMILANNDMQPSDVVKTMVPAVPTRLEMLRNNRVDVALLPEPFSSLAIKDGGTLLGSASELATYPSVLAFTQETINTKNEEIAAFYRAYNQAVEYINSTPMSEYEDTVITTVGYPEEMRGKIELPEFRKNTTLPPEAELQSVIEWVTQNGLVEKALTPKELVVDLKIK